MPYFRSVSIPMETNCMMIFIPLFQMGQIGSIHSQVRYFILPHLIGGFYDPLALNLRKRMPFFLLNLYFLNVFFMHQISFLAKQLVLKDLKYRQSPNITRLINGFYEPYLFINHPRATCFDNGKIKAYEIKISMTIEKEIHTTRIKLQKRKKL